MSSGGQVTIKPITRISLCQALLLHYLCERRPVLPREVRDELCVVPDHHLVARVAELLRDPPDLLAALERECRKGVPGLVHRPVAKTRAPERGLPHPFADVADVQRPTGAARKDVAAPQLARGPLLAKRVLDHREHLDVALRGFGLGPPPPAAGTDGCQDSDERWARAPIDRLPLSRDLFAQPEARKERDGEVALFLGRPKTLLEERLDLVERERIDWRPVFSQLADGARGVPREPP